MSRDEAHEVRAASSARAPTRMPAVRRITEEECPPQRPLFTARTDRVSGVIHTRGHLDGVAAESLHAVVTGLRELGHRDVVLLLGSTTVTDDAAASLAAQSRREDVGFHVLRE